MSRHVKALGLFGLLIFFLLLPAISGSAQSAELPAPKEDPKLPEDRNGVNDNLTIRISVMGPGDDVYFWWGHIALIIEDRVSQESRLYDYGLFSFENEHFYVNFALGRLLYSCGVSRTERNIAEYIMTNRDVTFYTLNLLPETKRKIREFAEVNVRPENRNYWYHHFRDNCSTRIRDIIDLAVDGQFSEAFHDAPGRFTLRQQISRFTWFSPFMDWFLNFLMGQDIDVPTTVWQEMFLPSEVGSRISDFRYTDIYGQQRNLVRSVDVINRSENRPLPLEVPRKHGPREFGLSLAIACVLGFLLAHREGKKARVILGIGQSLLGLFFGFAGVMVFFMSFFTNHDYTWHNMNNLFVYPLVLIAFPLGLLYAFSRNPFRRNLWGFLLRILWSFVFFGAVLSMLLRALPMFWQQNQATLALVLPFTAVLSLVPHWITRFRREYLWRWFN